MRIYSAMGPQLPFSSQIPTSSDPVESLRWQRLRDLVLGVEAAGDQRAEVVGVYVAPEIWLSKKALLVKVMVDWKDYAPLVDGFPEMHYRIVVQQDDNPKNELRTNSTGEAVRIIASALLP